MFKNEGTRKNLQWDTNGKGMVALLLLEDLQMEKF